MTTQYGIGVTKNRFELFDIDDEDPLEVLKFHEREKEARKKTKLSEKENKGKETVAKPKNISARKGIKETQNLKSHEVCKGKEDKAANVNMRGGYERSERKFVGDNREDRNNRRNRGDTDFQRDERGPDRVERKEVRGTISGSGPGTIETNESGSGNKGGLQPRSGRIGARGGGTAARGAGIVKNNRGGIQGSYRAPPPSFDSKTSKREYDRPIISDKSDVNGVLTQPQEDSNNWMQEKQPETENTAETNGGVTTTEVDEVGGVLEEERKELTLDEWKAMKAPRQKPTYNLRKAGEGEDLSQWKKMYALQKKKDGEEDDDDDEYEYESCEYPQRVGRQKHILDIDIHFKDTRNGGRTRGGRGAGRSGPRMGARATQPGVISNALSEKHAVHGRDHKSAPKVDDEHDFPSLG